VVTHFEQSHLFAGVDPQPAYGVVVVAPLPEIFAQRHGPLPRITEVRDQVGEWGTRVGQTRRIRMSDGGTVLETLTSLDPPLSFGYRLSEIGGPMKLLVAGLSGTWAFTAADGGTRVTWSWDVDARSALVSPAIVALRFFWNSYAAKALARADQMVPR
jgi:hypothetical protein